ncbi:hypothetical protein VCHA53O466_50395 [Vibrio chagasii]|nr:hypothetical protein VCHA53O466_50395 [Vibrio chagasii]
MTSTTTLMNLILVFKRELSSRGVTDYSISFQHDGAWHNNDKLTNLNSIDQLDGLKFESKVEGKDITCTMIKGDDGEFKMEESTRSSFSDRSAKSKDLFLHFRHLIVDQIMEAQDTELTHYFNAPFAS